MNRKEYEIIIEFRKWFLTLGYMTNNLTQGDLYEKVELWCNQHGIFDISIINTFRPLARNYAEKAVYEDLLCRCYRKKLFTFLVPANTKPCVQAPPSRYIKHRR